MSYCAPCKVDDHDNCTPRIGAVSLGLQDECDCWRYGEVHFVPAPLTTYVHKSWVGDERRDHQHDTGEDEHDTWIARSAMEMED